MNAERNGEHDSRLERALAELQGIILARWPGATFRVAPGEDEPDMTHLWTTVDIEDTDDVVDAVIDRLVELHVAERLPISVVPVRPLERVLQSQRRRAGVFPMIDSPTAAMEVR